MSDVKDGGAAPIWMGHAGHFICGRECQFRLNTYVNGFIVSTVGELVVSTTPRGKFTPLGAGPHPYETMVFRAKPTGEKCCPYEQADGQDLDSERYMTANEATEGHLAMIAKWSRAAPSQSQEGGDSDGS